MHTKRRKLFRLLGVLVVLLIVAGTYYYIQKPNTYKPTDNTPVAETNTTPAGKEATVSLAKDGVVPGTVQIAAGGTVTWTNDDSVNHTLIFTGNDDLNSDALKPKDTYTATFDTAGSYSYVDSANPAYKGTVIVQ